MRTRSGWAPVAVAALLAAGAWAFARVYLYSAESGEVFPEMSSLRADPRGARALHDALASLPGYGVRRWFRPLKEFRESNAAMLVLGSSPAVWRLAGPKDLEEIETVVNRGVRFAVALAPVKPLRAPAGAKPALTPVMEQRWKLRIAGGLEPLDSSWRIVRSRDGKPSAIERDFGKGSIAFLDASFPLSNEGLRDRRDSPLVSWTIGNHRVIVFDEYHLGTVQTGSVGTLIRQFHLEPAVAVLLILAALYIWRAGSSFLPPKEEPGSLAIAGRDSAEGLASLLRRSIPPAELPAVALGLWRKSVPLLPAVPSRVHRAVEEQLSRPVAPAGLLDVWRHLHQLTSKRT